MFGQDVVQSIFRIGVAGVSDLSVEGVLDKIVCGDKIKIANKHVRVLIRLGTEEFAGARGPAKQELGVGSLEQEKSIMSKLEDR